MARAPERPDDSEFPRVERTVVTVSDTPGDADEKAYWLSRSPDERLAALELMRQIAYGYDPTTARLQRVLELADCPPR